jgi:hypothetical protein
MNSSMIFMTTLINQHPIITPGKSWEAKREGVARLGLVCDSMGVVMEMHTIPPGMARVAVRCGCLSS